MKETQIKQFKINVTNIKNSLFKNNKTLTKIKKEKVRLFQTEQNKQKVSKKESVIESDSSFRKSISNIGQKLISGPLSLIDKFKEFFGLILLGILVNNLPTIIKKLQDVFGKIKGFLDRNPWIMKVVKFGFKIIGDGIMGLVKLIKDIKPYIGGSFKFALDTIKSTKNQIGDIIKTFDELDVAIGGLLKFFGISQSQQSQPRPQPRRNGGAPSGSRQRRQAAQRTPTQRPNTLKGSSYNPNSGRTYNPAYGVTGVLAPRKGVMGTMEPGKPETWRRYGPDITGPYVSGMNEDPNLYKQNVGRYKLLKGYAKGGTVKSDNTRTTTTATSRTPFARPGGTALGRKTIEKANAFRVFQTNVENQKSDQKDQRNNYNLMEELLKKFKELQKLRGKEKPDRGGGGGGGVYQSPEDIPLIGGPGIEGLSKFIAGAESEGRYDAYSGDGGTGDPAMLSMTLTELSQNYNMAVGAHQFMPSTAIGLARKIGLDPNKVVFNRETQDRLNRFHLNDLGYADFINGSLTDKDYGRRIAQEYRALPDPYTGKTYADQYANRNAARRTWDQFKQALADSKKSKNISLRTVTGADPNLTQMFSPVSGTSGSVKYNGQENAAVNIPYSPFSGTKGNPRITSTVGYRGSTKSNHRGLDIEADEGTPVYAYLPGTVTKSGDYGDGYGNSFEWKDSKGNLHFFGHLQVPAFLKVGEQVIQGRNVGKVGKTGRSTGPHLHWEIRRSSGGQQYTDPVSWVKSFSLPKPTSPVTPTGGQQIIPNFGTPVGQRIPFVLGGVEYHAYKTRVGFDFYKGGSFGGIGATKVTNPNEQKIVTEAFIKYMESSKKPAVEPGTNAASLLFLEQKGIQVPPKTSELASSATSAQKSSGVITNTIILDKTRYVVT